MMIRRVCNDSVHNIGSVRGDKSQNNSLLKANRAERSLNGKKSPRE